MILSSFIVVLLANHCVGSGSTELKQDGNIQIGSKSVIVDPMPDLKWLHALSDPKQQPNADQIFNQNLEMVASENEFTLNGKLPSGKRRFDDYALAEASVGHSRGSYRQEGEENRNQGQRNRPNSSQRNVGYDDQVANTNQNYNRRPALNNHGKNNHRGGNTKSVAESRKSSSKPFVNQNIKTDDIFDDDNDDNRASKRSDSDESIFRDDDDESDSQDERSQHHGAANLRAAAGTNPYNLRYDGNALNFRDGNNNDQASSSNDDGGESDDEERDIDSTNLTKQKVLPAKEAKKQKNQRKSQAVKRRERAHQSSSPSSSSNKFNRRSDEGENPRQSQSASDNNNNEYENDEQEDASSISGQHVKHSLGDLQTAAGHHHGKSHGGSHGHYYQYAGQPKKKAYKWGFKRGNKKHESK